MPRGTQDTHRALCHFAYRTVTVYGRPFQGILLSHSVPQLGPATPTPQQSMQHALRSRQQKDLTLSSLLSTYSLLRTLLWGRFGLFPVRSPLLGESRLISLPPGTEMFHFPGFASYTYVFSV